MSSQFSFLERTLDPHLSKLSIGLFTRYTHYFSSDTTMPERTPLLPNSDRPPPHENPVFLRVCHSPWYFLDQKSLLLLRGLLAIYMITVLAFSIEYSIKHNHHEEQFVFNASHISFFVQTVYYWITAVSHISIGISNQLIEGYSLALDASAPSLASKRGAFRRWPCSTFKTSFLYFKGYGLQ